MVMRKVLGILTVAIVFVLAGCFVNPTKPNKPTDLSDIAGWRGAAVNSPDTFRFVVLSDRTGGHIPGLWAQSVAETNRLKPDFVMFIGDLIEGYTDDEKEIRRQWTHIDAITRRLDAPFFYCPGNHDVLPDACRKIYTELHGVAGKAWYSFDYRRCHFIVADSSAMIGKDKKLADDQWAWLKKDLAGANKVSDHVFVFIHHPMNYGSRIPSWNRLRKMLDAKKTTVFSGHWHSPLSYDLEDGVPYYMISATAAGSGGAPENPNREIGEFQSYAHVVVDRGKPTISFVPLGEILPHDFIDRSVILRLRTLIEAATLGSVTGAGGEVTLKLPNTTDADAACRLTWTGRDKWFVGGRPGIETITIPAGKTIERTYRIAPSGPGEISPVLFIHYEITAESRTMQITRKLPLQIVASLTARPVKSITIDGKLDDWADASTHLTNTRERVKYKPEAWSGQEDCSFDTRIGYDDENLYLAIDVTDDVVVGSEGGSQWERDGVMIFWDPRPPDQRGGRFADPCKMVRIWASHVTIGLQKGTIQGCRMVSRRREGGYTFELAIPFSAIDKDFKPAAGQTFGLEIVVHDKDKTPAQAITGMVLSGGTNTWRSTAGYAVVTFQ
ncbi:MAG: sugar-binding protein [Planctomycetota bacterium]|nr:sugar-binding protein [Planctomycetota bacterium]